ncbi:hypothetical protein GmHk_18G052126 [Glycine max]|nr:hypothetical protein GmHk_18G052126 [Glycine max]
MGKDWGPGTADAGCTGKSSHSVVSDPYDWLPASRSHAAYMRASGALSSACEQRWTPEMVVVVEVAAVHLRLAAAVPDPAVVPALAYNTFL